MSFLLPLAGPLGIGLFGCASAGPQSHLDSPANPGMHLGLLRGILIVAVTPWVTDSDRDTVLPAGFGVEAWGTSLPAIGSLGGGDRITDTPFVVDRGALYDAAILPIVLYPPFLRAIDSLLLSHVVHDVEHVVILFVGVDIARIPGQSKRIGVVGSHLLRHCLFGTGDNAVNIQGAIILGSENSDRFWLLREMISNHAPFPSAAKNNSLHIGHLISKLAGTFLDKFVELRIVEVGASRDIGNPALSKRSELGAKVVRGIDTMS